MSVRKDTQPSGEIWVCHLGLVPYGEAVAIQQQLHARRRAGEIPDTLLLLEHPPTYTRGRRAAAEELPFPESFYEARGAEVHSTDRGGRITYHGPGQLVGYPIMAVGDVHEHLRRMEAAIIHALGEIGVSGRTRRDEGADYTGVWVDQCKVASLGVHISHGISTHGFAVNVENDIEPFNWVIACGLPDVKMTSIALETGGSGEGIHCFRKRMAYSFCHTHAKRQRIVSPARLGIRPTDPSRLAPGRAPHEQSPEAVPA